MTEMVNLTTVIGGLQSILSVSVKFSAALCLHNIEGVPGKKPQMTSDK